MARTSRATASRLLKSRARGDGNAEIYRKGTRHGGEIRRRARPGLHHAGGRGGAPRDPARSDRPGEDRRDLHRLRVASVRRQAQQHRRLRGDRDHPLDPHRRPGVRLQGGHRGDVPVRAPGRGGRRRVRPGDRLRHRAGRAGRPARVRHRRRRRGVPLRARRRRGDDGRFDLLHHGHARLLAPRGGAVPAARRALHGRAGLFPSHDDGGAETASSRPA